MISFWNKLKSIFVQKHKEDTVADFKKEELVYTGHEKECWACSQPIHKTHRSRRLNGNHIHIKCFRKLKRIALGGKNINGF